MQEEDWLQEGMTVELRSDQEGYNGAWFPVKILELCYRKNRVCRQVRVEYLDFRESPALDSPKLQEAVKKDNLRPFPPKLPHKQWKERDVETLYEGAWWIGYIKSYDAKKDTYLVFYGRGCEDLHIPASDVRSRQNYARHSPCNNQRSWDISPAMKKPADWEKN